MLQVLPPDRGIYLSYLYSNFALKFLKHFKIIYLQYCEILITARVVSIMTRAQDLPQQLKTPLQFNLSEHYGTVLLPLTAFKDLTHTLTGKPNSAYKPAPRTGLACALDKVEKLIKLGI